MLDITGYTQEQIEEFFSQESLEEYLAIELAEIVEQISTEHYQAVMDITKLNEDETLSFMLNMIAVLGDTKCGITLENGTRYVEIEHFVSLISDILPNGTYDYRVQIALDMLCEFDDVFFDVCQEQRLSEDKNFYTHTYIELGLTVGNQDEIALRRGLTRFRLPMIEQPMDWVQGSDIKGGYYDNSSKLTSNKGSQQQPQECLDVLNKLQRNAYMLNDYSLAIEHNSIMDKLVESNWKYDRLSKEQLHAQNLNTANTIMQTTAESYKNMENKKFYFVWFFDFRGRMYSRGYDINLQATKIKKAMLKAV